MKEKFTIAGKTLGIFIPFLPSLLLFWLILSAQIPESFNRYFHTYSFGLFLIVAALYYISFSFYGKLGTLLSLGLTMALMALSLSYLWTSGFSDNFIIGGLLPYKDGKNYYAGAHLLLSGFPMLNAGQASERPLFPGFLASLLWLTGQNLKLTIGIIVQLAGVAIFFSIQQIRNLVGLLAASLFATLLYLYILPFIGYTLSELLGFTAGCLGFTLILIASQDHNWFDLILGVVALLIGVSARAGAFIIFPMLALWIGWVFRENKPFAMKLVVYAMVLTSTLFLLLNSVYSRSLGIPSGSSFGNFSYSIYGQVRGGTGWHSAIEELGTRDSNIVYRAAWDYFLKHPISLAISFAKSYRDFFWIGSLSIFPFSGQRQLYALDIFIWLGMLALLLRGIIQLAKGVRTRPDSLLLAAFLGIFISIPFLPPVDGGTRFHAATIPFFFAVLAAGLRGISGKVRVKSTDASIGDPAFCRSASILLLLMIILAPLVMRVSKVKPILAMLDCPVDQRPFVIESHPGSYLDLIQDKSLESSRVPRVNLDDFETNNSELSVDDYYQTLVSLAKNARSNIRLFPAFDLIENEFHYFFVPLSKLPNGNFVGRIAGCAIYIKTKNQSIFQVKSVLSSGS